MALNNLIFYFLVFAIFIFFYLFLKGIGIYTYSLPSGAIVENHATSIKNIGTIKSKQRILIWKKSNITKITRNIIIDIIRSEKLCIFMVYIILIYIFFIVGIFFCIFRNSSFSYFYYIFMNLFYCFHFLYSYKNCSSNNSNIFDITWIIYHGF